MVLRKRYRPRLSVRSIVIVILFLIHQSIVAQMLPDLERLRARAQQGYVDDQLELARVFRLGLGVKADLQASAGWLSRAANMGSPEAQTDLGYAYFTGSGVPKD